MAQDVESLGEWIAEQAAHLDAATHRLLTALREFDVVGGWYKQGARSCAEWLSWRVGWSRQTARDRVRVAQRLGELPLIDDELRRGALSYCKVRAMTRVATPANEAALVELAKHSTGAQLDRICRKYAAVQRQGTEPDEKSDAEQRYISRRELDSGFVEISARLHPEEAAAVWAALDRMVKERFRNGSQPQASRGLGRVDALVALAQEVLRGDSPNRSPIELVVTTDADALRDPVNAAEPIGTTSDGTCVSAETVRRLSCDCGVVHVAEDAHGRTVSVGRKTRSIPTSLKRALLRRDQTCRFPGCDNRLFVEGHHIQHWANGGDTSLLNLCLVCSRHHRFVHEYGYRVELDEEQQPRFFDPRGRRVVDAPASPANSYRGHEIMRSINRELDITADTPACGWDGAPVDYDWVIDALVCRDDAPVHPT
jgi:hypothetical protein